MELQKETFGVIGNELSIINTTQNEENFTMILDRNDK